MFQVLLIKETKKIGHDLLNSWSQNKQEKTPLTNS